MTLVVFSNFDISVFCFIKCGLICASTLGHVFSLGELLFERNNTVSSLLIMGGGF